jgi:hypothetical protein
MSLASGEAIGDAHGVICRRDRVNRMRGIMDKATIELLARRAGLEKALAEFPDDVAAAAEQASTALARIKAPTDPRAEPWPPMRAGGGL